jgi:hypothetical protein
MPGSLLNAADLAEASIIPIQTLIQPDSDVERRFEPVFEGCSWCGFLTSAKFVSRAPAGGSLARSPSVQHSSVPTLADMVLSAEINVGGMTVITRAGQSGGLGQKQPWPQRV